MQLTSLLESAARAVSARPDRPATAILHDSPAARIVVFRLLPGQVVAVHTSPSRVSLFVTAGRGAFSGAEAETDGAAGDLIVYEPQEPHGFRAIDETLVVTAVITPRPGGA